MIKKIVGDELGFSVGVWPARSADSTKAIFEAAPKNDNWKVGIYEINISPSKKDRKLRRIVSGRRPSLSPSKKLLAYIDADLHLVVDDFRTGKQRVISQVELDNSVPPVWVDDEKLIFYGEADEEIIEVNIQTGSISRWGIQRYLPVALSPTNTLIACVAADGLSIALLDVGTRQMNVILQNRFLTYGPGIVWSADGERILYSRQAWRHIFRFSEAADVFQYSLDGTEQHFKTTMVIFGGTPF